MSFNQIPWGYIDTAFVSLILGMWIMSLLAGRVLKVNARSYKVSLRRARRINVATDTQVINGTQVITRITINGKNALLIYTASASPIEVQVRNGDGSESPYEKQTISGVHH